MYLDEKKVSVARGAVAGGIAKAQILSQEARFQRPEYAALLEAPPLQSEGGEPHPGFGK